MSLEKKNTTRKRRKVSNIIQIIFFIALFILIRGWMQRDMVSGVAPDIMATDLHGEQVSLTEYRGEPLLLYFWASWCKICEFGDGAVDSVSKNWPLLSVAMQSGDQHEVAKFLQSQNLQWRTIADQSGELARRFGVAGVPAYYILDANGTIRFTERGYTTSWGLAARLWFTRVFYAEKHDEGAAISRQGG